MQLPFYSRARQFDDLQPARVWLQGDPMLDDGTIWLRLDGGLTRLESINWNSKDPLAGLPLDKSGGQRLRRSFIYGGRKCQVCWC